MSRHSTKLIRDCAANLTLTVGEIMSIAKTAPKRYYVWEIPKRSGKGSRTVCHPARELKRIQYYFLNYVLCKLPIHASATAYVAGSSIKNNAKIHANSRVIMKIDFSDFFTSLKVENWRRYALEYFPEWSEEELDFSCHILFWGQGSYRPKCLAIGAPTSPLISNALMYEVDLNLSSYATTKNMNYSRYADDITFSSRGFLDYEATMSAVKIALLQARNTSVQINREKTVLASSSSTRRVTGLVITPNKKISLGRDRKRLISAMVHHAYCRSLAPADWPKLAGLLAFAADVEPEFIERLNVKYPPGLIRWILRYGTREVPT